MQGAQGKQEEMLGRRHTLKDRNELAKKGKHAGFFTPGGKGNET